MSTSRAIRCMLCAALLSACGKADNSGDNSNEAYGADATLLASKDHGMAALKKRLRENLRLENGVVVVDGPIVSGAVTLSKNSAWSVSCGPGVTVDIGKGEINLVTIAMPIDDPQCAYLTQRLGVEVQAILDGRKLNSIFP